MLSQAGLLQPGFTSLTGFPRDEAAMLEAGDFSCRRQFGAWLVCACRSVCSWVLDRILACTLVEAKVFLDREAVHASAYASARARTREKRTTQGSMQWLSEF